jgi:uncharacterized membrane protein
VVLHLLCGNVASITSSSSITNSSSSITRSSIAIAQLHALCFALLFIRTLLLLLFAIPCWGSICHDIITVIRP